MINERRQQQACNNFSTMPPQLGEEYSQVFQDAVAQAASENIQKSD